MSGHCGVPGTYSYILSKLSQATKDYVESCNTEISRQLSNLSESYQDYQYQQEQQIQGELSASVAKTLQ